MTTNSNSAEADQPASAGCVSQLLVPLSCPFCGSQSGKAKAMPKRDYDSMVFMIVECQCCGACGPVSAGADSQKAIRKWNERERNKPIPPCPRCGYCGFIEDSDMNLAGQCPECRGAGRLIRCDADVKTNG